MASQAEESPTPKWLRVLRWLGVDLRPEETGLLGGLFTASFLLGVFQFSSKAVRQASYIDQFGADRLPYVYLLVAVSAYPVLRLYGLVAQKWSPLAVIAATVATIVAGLIAFWWLMADPPSWVPVAYYVWVAIATALALTQLWSLASTCLDARQARRLFGLIGAGSLLGGVVGGQVASLSRNEPRNALLIAAAMLMLMVLVVYRLERAGKQRRSLSGDSLDGIATRAPTDEARLRGFDLLSSSNHLRLIAGILLITVVVAQIIDLQFSWVVESTRDSSAGRVSAFGNVFSLMGLAAFIFQLVLTPRIHRSFGVGHAMRVLPAFVTLGCLGLLLASSLAPALLVFAVGMLRIGDNGLRYSLDHVTRELLFVPVPASQRVEAKGYVDVFVHRFGKALGAVLLLSVTFGWVTPLQLTWATLLLVAVWFWLTAGAKRHYVEALRTGLTESDGLSGDGDQASDMAIDPNDVNTLEILVEAFGSADASKVLGSLELLRAHDRAKLVPPLLLYHDDRRVRKATLEVMMEAERKDALPLIERCVADPDAEVRVAAISALASLSGRRGPELMIRRLEDAEPRVRAAAAHCVLSQGGPEQAEQAEATLQELLSDGAPAVRVEAVKVLGDLPEPLLQRQIVAALFDADKQVVRAMIISLRNRVSGANSSPMYVPILISLLRDRRLKHDARETLVAYGPSVLPALSHFLNDSNEQIWVRRALPKTIAQFSGRGAIPVLYESLESSADPLQRAKVIEALVAMPEHACDQQRLHRCLHEMARQYFENLLALHSLSAGAISLKGTHLEWNGDRVGQAEALLRRESHLPLALRLLAEERESLLSNITGLIKILLPGVELNNERTERMEEQERRRSSSHAVEYLDNVLDGRLRDELLLVLDDIPLDRRLKSARALFNVPLRSQEGALKWLLSRSNGHEMERWLAAAAAYWVGHEKIESLMPLVARLAAQDGRGLVQETAELFVSGKAVK